MSNLAMTMSLSRGVTVGPITYQVGLTPSLDSVSGENSVWSQRTVDISVFAGATVRPVFYYVSGSNFTGDIQLDAIDLDGTLYDFESGNDGWETSSAESSVYDSVNWIAVPTTADASPRFSRDSGGTSSTGTGLTTAASGSFYLYAETSSNGFPSTPFWLRGPEVTLSGSPTFSYYEARAGATIGTLNFYLDVIS